ncbi:hypothetical protein H9P43_006433 [Blastocladiella emersonii ATCC 22665]|nr:hypothetical protein H9P43_006433 [Blastocladiella emersonii ATCC 22665]
MNVGTLIEDILVRAVWAHVDPSDVLGLAQYARVLPMRDGVKVHRAILQRVPSLSMDCANARGATGVLDLWVASGLPLNFSVKGICAAERVRHLETFDWWRTSGLLTPDTFDPFMSRAATAALGFRRDAKQAQKKDGKKR